ncbi:MAG: class I SAM-dependent methyltransferase [bacterium]
MNIKSPITQSNNTAFEKSISVEWIIEKYKKNLHIDVSKFFAGLKKIEIYKCLDTGYRFYHPFCISGDGKFYEDLEKLPWYYPDWKWEHSIAESLIKHSDKILEIGCAYGNFLEKMHKNGFECAGLELNESAVKDGIKKGLKILNQSIQNHSKENNEKYDIVCSFQVAEHIADIQKFLEDSISALKHNGKLIISVPNNDSLLFKCNDDLMLNYPPHHMGLWDINSLISLQKYFNLQIEGIYIEPLQSYHFGFAKAETERKFIKQTKNKYGIIYSLLKPLSKKFIDLNAVALTKYIIGHTIMAVYVKK